MDSEEEASLLLDRLSSAADKICGPHGVQSAEHRAHDEDLLALAQSLLDPSTPSGEALLDSVGMDMPRILAKFAVSSHEPCKEKAISILRSLPKFCDPRDMFAAYMEALNLYSEPETLSVCIVLLDDLPEIFTRMRRRRLEFFEESLLGLLGVYRLAVDTGSRVQEVFDRMAQVIIAVHGVSESEEVAEKRQRLQQTIGSFILLLLAKGYEFLATDPLQRTILLLINLLPECGFTYLDMITGDYLQNVSNWIYEETFNTESQIWDTKQGAVLAVCWSFCGDETISNQVDLELFLHQLCGSTDVFIKSLSNLSILLSSASPKTVEMGIDFLATILETSTSKQMFPSFRLLHADNEVFRLQDFLQAIQRVMIFSPLSKTRQHAYKILVLTIRQVLCPVERYEMLKLLIIESTQSSMVSLLMYIVKEEVEKAISSQNVLEVVEDVRQESPFASRKVLDLIDFVLRPPSGGPPDLPHQTDAVLSALNLYRFILIRESSGKTNRTGILQKENLEQARLKWLEPLRVFLQGFRLRLHSSESEADLCAELSMANVEGVIYRCLELVEEALRCSSS